MGKFRRGGRGILAAGLVVAGTVGALTVATPAHATEVYNLPSSGTFSVAVKGNGHGHGMSQYGAYGAAKAGLSAAQIVGFYYPGTTLTTLAPSTIRVLIGSAGPTTVVAPAAGLTVTGRSGALPTSGVSRFQLVAGTNSTLTLQQLSGATWTTVQTGLPNGAQFSSPSGNVRVFLTDGTSTLYDGTIRSLVNGASVQTINVVSLDDYTAGVTPRESPASWPAAAVQAQAIAARSYGRNAVESHASASYDICDSSSCQVYGGAVHYDATGKVLWTDYQAALTGNSNMVLRSGGSTIFAQFSASNGGWTSAGSTAYLPAQADPYDTATYDPYFSYTRTPSVTTLASYYGLAKVSSIAITGRDGHGSWGGRVATAVVSGVTGSGSATQVSTTGSALASALGLGSTWFLPSSSGAVQTQTSTPTTAAPRPSAGALDRLVPTGAHGVYVATGWVIDPSVPDRSPTQIMSVDNGSWHAVTAAVARPDVQRIYGTSYSQYGYANTFTVPDGFHLVCAGMADIATGAQHTFACQWLLVRPAASGGRLPRGRVDVLAARSGGYTVRGWAMDPDHTSAPVEIVLAVDNTIVAVVAANTARPDVARAYRTPTNQFGFTSALSARAGKHRVCVYAYDLDTARRTTLSCRSVRTG